MRFLYAFLICIVCSSCGTLGFKPKDRPSTTIEQAIVETREASKQIKEIAGRIDKSADSIRENAESIRESVPDEVKNQVQPQLESILEDTISIKNEAKNLEQVSKNEGSTADKLEKAAKSSVDLEKEILALQAERDEALAKQRAADRSKLMYLIIAGIVLVAGSLAACSYGMKATIVAVFGIILIITSLTVSFMIENLEVVGFLGAAIAVGIIGYAIYRQRRDKRATEEVVHTMEVMKDSLPQEQKKKIFGSGATPGVAFQIQSGGTEEIVRGIRSKFRPSWEPIVNS